MQNKNNPGLDCKLLMISQRMAQEHSTRKNMDHGRGRFLFFLPSYLIKRMTYSCVSLYSYRHGKVGGPCQHHLAEGQHQGEQVVVGPVEPDAANRLQFKRPFNQSPKTSIYII